MAKDEKNSGSNKKSSGLLVACWFLLLLILLILFFVKKDLITANLEKTDFFGKVFGGSTEQASVKNDGKSTISTESSESTENAESAPFAFDLNARDSLHAETKVYQEATGSESVKAVQEDALVISQDNEFATKAERSTIVNANANTKLTRDYDNHKPESQNAKSGRAETAESIEKSTAESAKAQRPKESHANDTAKASAQKPQSTQTAKPDQSSQTNQPAHPSQKSEATTATSRTVGEREATLFFVSIAPDGSVSRKSVKRTLAKSDSPLTDSINALLEGPLPSEREKNCMSLIPEGSKLLGASIKNGVANLNFNEQFEFNGLGVEGYVAQLMQIVYTSTEFSTVSSVQFLIEGERRDYLGSEGQWIGTPLSRNSF